MGKAMVAALALALSGCANLDHVTTEYGSLKPVSHTNHNDAFKVYDKPEESRLLISLSVDTFMAGGPARSITLGSSGPAAARPIFQEAVAEYLATTGRTCRITGGYLVIEPTWEFKYDCSPAVAATAAPTTTGTVHR